MLSRRRFLGRTLVGGALLAAGGAIGSRHVGGYVLDGAIAARLRVLSPKEYLVLAAACRRQLAPDERGAPSPDEIGAPLVIDGYLAGLPADLVSDVRALLHLLEHWGVWTRFTRMGAATQDEVLAGWESSRLDVRRRGFRALKSLALLGYYDDPRTFAILDYSGPMLPPATSGAP
jgi:hypothetical protein